MTIFVCHGFISISIDPYRLIYLICDEHAHELLIAQRVSIVQRRAIHAVNGLDQRRVLLQEEPKTKSQYKIYINKFDLVKRIEPSEFNRSKPKKTKLA